VLVGSVNPSTSGGTGPRTSGRGRGMRRFIAALDRVILTSSRGAPVTRRRPDPHPRGPDVLRWGAFVYRHRRIVALIALVVAVAALPFASRASGKLTSGGWLDPLWSPRR